MADNGNKIARFNLNDEQGLRAVARALSSEIRLAILRTLQTGNKSIGELSEALQVPMSTISTSVSILAEAGLIITQYKPQEHGVLKLCSQSLSRVVLDLSSDASAETGEKSKSLTMNMPVGCYSDAQNITSTCGLCSEYSIIGEKDVTLSFFHPDRFSAQRIWFHSGFVEYRFSFAFMNNIEFKWLEISFETCSEAPMYRDPWKSDIDVFVNGKELGIFELDESYFGAKRVRGKRGRGAAGKTPVFGVLKREGKVFVSIVPRCSREELLPIIQGKILEGSTIHTDGWKAYDGLILNGYTHYRVFHHENEFVRGKSHVNGIESFWNFAKRR